MGLALGGATVDSQFFESALVAGDGDDVGFVI